MYVELVCGLLVVVCLGCVCEGFIVKFFSQLSFSPFDVERMRDEFVIDDKWL